MGREEELGSLLAALESLPTAAVLSGEAGIGKTALWLAALEEARRRELTVLTCRPSDAETGYSFSGLADLLDGIDVDELPELPPPQRRALETALARVEAGERVEERLVAFAFLGAVRGLAEDRALVLAIDDLQWLDRSSEALLRYVLSRLESERVATFLTVRGDPPQWLARSETARVVELRPLSVGALHELLRTRLAAPLPRPVLLRIWETSGGNPFFALELARALERRGGRIEPGAALPVPATLEELVLERLRSLSPDAEAVCRVVAAAADATTTLVERAVGEASGAGLEDALRAGVLELDGERLRFSHPLLASAVAARTVGERKRALHERLAALAVDPEEQARHLALVSEPSADVAAALDESARRARARGAAGAAAELAEQAVALTPAGDDDALLQRRLQAADLHFEAGDVQRALAVLEDARRAAPAGPSRAAVLFRIARIRAETHGVVEAVSVWREALAEAAGDDELEARILLELGQFLRFTAGTEEALVYLRRAVAAADRVGDDALTCRVLGAHALAHFNGGHGIDSAGIERALELERRLTGTVAATPYLVHHLVWTGDVDRAREALARWSAWAESREHVEAGDAAWYLGLLEWRHGNWTAAADSAATAIAVTEQFGRDATTIAAWLEAVVAAHRGDLERAEALAAQGLAVTVVPDVAVAGFEWVRGFGELSRGDASAALPHLVHAWQINADLEIREPALQWFMPDLLDALLAVGDVEQAAEALAPFARLARALDRPWALAVAGRAEGLTLAAQGDLDGAFARLTDALEQHERAPDRFQQARTLLALGATQRRAKQRRAARETLGRARTFFAALPAPYWEAKAEAELGRIGGRAASRAELTAAERRIAACVAEGMTNREVAAALYLTEHSVETALSRVYRKLGVRSRTELARRLAATTEESPASNS